jgi:hypothetical protein
MNSTGAAPTRQEKKAPGKDRQLDGNYVGRMQSLDDFGSFQPAVLSKAAERNRFSGRDENNVMDATRV